MILYDKPITLSNYLEIMTGKYYFLNGDNQPEDAEYILYKTFGKKIYSNYHFYDVDELLGEDKKVVLVEITNIITDSNNDKTDMESQYLWFEVPVKWSREYFLNRMNEI